MTEQTENATRLARPIIRLAKLVGIATSYVGMSRDYHEIEDDVLVAVLKALGIDASNDGAIEQSITTIQRERDTRIVPPAVLHVVGKESKVEVHGGALDVPEASIMLEDGGAYAGKIELEGGSDTVVEVDGGFVCTSYLVLPADLPEGYHTLEVTVGGKTEIATVISAPEKIELLDDMKEGSLWGWMSQLYSIRSSGSWGIGDYEDLKTLLVESKKKTGADFMLINPLHAAEPVPPIEPSPYLPISRRFINFSYIRPESMPEYAVLRRKTRRKWMNCMSRSSRSTAMRGSWIAKPCGVPRCRRCGSSTSPAFPHSVKPSSTSISPKWAMRSNPMPHGACATTSGAPRMAATTIGCASTIVIPRKSRSFAHSTRTRLNSIVGSNGSPPSSCMRPSRRRARPA